MAKEEQKTIIGHYILYHPQLLKRITEFLGEIEAELNKPICEHLPDDPDVEECSVCSYRPEPC